MLKPTDKVSFGLMSELPGCNVSERGASLVTANDSGGRAVHLSAKTAWAISDWLKG